jgi:hypothetical protein
MDPIEAHFKGTPEEYQLACYLMDGHPCDQLTFMDKMRLMTLYINAQLLHYRHVWEMKKLESQLENLNM